MQNLIDYIYIIFIIIMIIGFLTGVGIGFLVFWIQFKNRLLNLFIANAELADRFDAIVDLWEEEEYKKDEEINEHL